MIFTSGGTESDNLALRGVAAAMSGRGRGKHIITTATEHHAIVDTAKDLIDQGFDVTFLPVNEYGQVTAQADRCRLTRRHHPCERDLREQRGRLDQPYC